MKTIKQISVFLENRQGTLNKILNILGNEKIEVFAISVADTNSYGILRLITSNQLKASGLLRSNGILADLNEVLAIKVEPDTQSINHAIESLTGKGVTIKYLYTFHAAGKLILIIRPDQMELAEKAALQSNLDLEQGWE